MRASKSIALGLTACMLVACTEPNGAPGRGVENGGAVSKEDIGTAAGVVGGGIIGSTIGGGAGKAVAVVGGALLGGLLGNRVGKSLDNADRAAYDRASQNALESGTKQSWKNPDTGHHGTITPKKSYTNDEGESCRTYTQTIYIGGQPKTGYGKACRSADGSWEIVSK